MSSTLTFKINAVTCELDLRRLEAIVFMPLSIWQEIFPVIAEPEMVNYFQLLEKTSNQTGNE